MSHPPLSHTSFFRRDRRHAETFGIRPWPWLYHLLSTLPKNLTYGFFQAKSGLIFQQRNHPSQNRICIRPTGDHPINDVRCVSMSCASDARQTMFTKPYIKFSTSDTCGRIENVQECFFRTRRACFPNAMQPTKRLIFEMSPSPLHTMFFCLH